MKQKSVPVCKNYAKREMKFGIVKHHMEKCRKINKKDKKNIEFQAITIINRFIR